MPAGADGVCSCHHDGGWPGGPPAPPRRALALPAQALQGSLTTRAPCCSEASWGVLWIWCSGTPADQESCMARTRCKNQALALQGRSIGAPELHDASALAAPPAVGQFRPLPRRSLVITACIHGRSSSRATLTAQQRRLSHRAALPAVCSSLDAHRFELLAASMVETRNRWARRLGRPAPAACCRPHDRLANPDPCHRSSRCADAGASRQRHQWRCPTRRRAAGGRRLLRRRLAPTAWTGPRSTGRSTSSSCVRSRPASSGESRGECALQTGAGRGAAAPEPNGHAATACSAGLRP